MSHAIVVDDLRFTWPDGALLFDGIGFAVGPGRSALIGANGSGKSTLLRLIAGELVPSRGSVRVAGSLGWLRQDLTLTADLAVEEVLGITRARRALRAIEPARSPPSPSPPSATTGTWRSAPAPPWTGSVSAAWGWTGAWARRRAGGGDHPLAAPGRPAHPDRTALAGRLGRAYARTRSSRSNGLPSPCHRADEGDSDARSAAGGPQVAR
jgi:energy-coupling factor transporter ATP-binding protein EcfA2